MENDKAALVFDHFKTDDPKQLWRVLYVRKWGKNDSRTARCCDYFDNELAAWQFVSVQIEAGHEVKSVRQFEAKDACNG